MFFAIEEFLAVAETENFTKAAQRLSVSAAHVSRRVAALETKLGTRLFSRTTRQVSLTQAGERYYLYCRQAADAMEMADSQARDTHQSLSGRLRVSAAGHFSEQYVAPALIRFAALHPQLNLELDFNSRYINLIEDGYDLAIRYGHLQDSSLVAQPLVRRRMMMAAAPDYLQRHGTPQSPEALQQHRCLLTNSEHWRLSIKKQSIKIRVNEAFRSNNVGVVLQAAKQGLGLVYLPDSSVCQHVESGELKAVMQDYWEPEVPTWLVYANRKLLPVRTVKAIEFLQQELGQSESL